MKLMIFFKYLISKRKVYLYLCQVCAILFVMFVCYEFMFCIQLLEDFFFERTTLSVMYFDDLRDAIDSSINNGRGQHILAHREQFGWPGLPTSRTPDYQGGLDRLRQLEMERSNSSGYITGRPVVASNWVVVAAKIIVVGGIGLGIYYSRT